MTDILVVLEQRDGAVKRVSHEALGAARKLADSAGCEVHGVVVGSANVDTGNLGTFGADRVLTVADDSAQLYQPELYAATVAEIAKKGSYGAVLLPATALGRDLGPRLAAKIDCPLTADVTDVSYDDGLVVTRPAYSGKATYTLRVTSSTAVVSLRPNAVSPVEGQREAAVEERATSEAVRERRATTVEVKEPERAAVDVAEASVVVSGGRGLKEPEHFKLVEELAEAVGGAVGASRAVVDAGWRPHSEQVGQTGKTVSPNLYIAIGISGAVQHLAGMRTAKVIVAINKDREAPIFKVADYGIVGDLFEVVPRLTQEIRRLREN